jgi:hypothetical protein
MHLEKILEINSRKYYKLQVSAKLSYESSREIKQTLGMF